MPRIRLLWAFWIEFGLISAFLALASASAQSTGIWREVFTDISGTSLPSLTNSPSYPGQFQIDHGIAVNAADIGPGSSNLVLTVTTMAYGASYTATLNQISDIAQNPNSLAPNTTVAFRVVEYVPVDIGNPSIAGDDAYGANGILLVAGGTGIKGTSDQFHFSHQEKTGNFDLKTRLHALNPSDLFAMAGLMARESLSTNSRFAATLATPATAGCFCRYRLAPGSSALTTGSFPVNYPETWLRLARSGNRFTSYASVDGRVWIVLGTVDIALPSKVYCGLAVAASSSTTATTADFRQTGAATERTVGSYEPACEPLGPSSRHTGLVFSEIMYHPKARKDQRQLEFIELYNAGVVFENLSGCRLGGDVDYTIPEGTILPAGGFLVVAKVPGDIEAVYGIAGVLGPFSNRLSNENGQVTLLNRSGAVQLRAEYSGQPPYPVSADGGGHSLILARPSYGEGAALAWGPSEWMGGSPGVMECVRPNPQAGVLINEILARADDREASFIELYNHSNDTVDLSGCWLTDDPDSYKHCLREGALIPARGYLQLNQGQLGFDLNPSGGQLLLINAGTNRILDGVWYGAQEKDIALGRSPDGSSELRRLASPTPASANSMIRIEPAVINEIMYNPLSNEDNDEYIELHNPTDQAVSLAGWKFVAGIDFTFPSQAWLPAQGYLVVGRDRDRLLSQYPQLSPSNTFGNYEGSLRNSGERLALAKPEWLATTNIMDLAETNRIDIVVSEVTYGAGGRWGRWSDGGGSSLELTDPRADPRQAAHWADSDESNKAGWTLAAYTGPATLGQSSANRFQIVMQGEGECLIDDISIARSGSTNLLTNGGFENGNLPGATAWSFFGNHSLSSVEAGSAAVGTRCLHVRSSGDGDTGINSIRANLTSILAANSTVNLTARVRWLAGWPEVLFRTRGGWIDVPVRMELPRNLGTPGLPNSRRVANAGPAIFEVTHKPILPRANQPVAVACRVSDPDGINQVQLRWRLDPNKTVDTVILRDDGTGGDNIAGDGLYGGTIGGQSAGSLVAFSIAATDAATDAASAAFPSDAPQRECLIRWNDPLPSGSFSHYYLWSTRQTEQARQGSPALNNTYRDATLVYGNFRVIYNAGFRDKGSPYHGGSGDYAVTVPSDDLLLGVTDRIFASTGNGGSEPTGLRGQLAAWLAQEMDIPYLHAHYVHLYRNGSHFRNIVEDLEQPNRQYAQDWVPDVDRGDLYKVAVWFEFQDNNTSFSSVDATLERFLSGGAYPTGRYRWNFQVRPNTRTANNFTNLFDLITAANNTTTNAVNVLLNQAEIEQWMRVFAYHRIMGNWDSWSYNVGQNMYIYKPPGQRWVLMPWDIDFVFGLGDGASSANLWGGQDPVINQMCSKPAFRRMLWRAYIDAVNGPLLSESYSPQIQARYAALLNNGITGISNPQSISTYINSRRNYLINQIKRNDAAQFAITSNGGNEFTSTTPSAVIAGTAPFSVSQIEINDVPYPVTWLDPTNFRTTVPLTQATNVLRLAGRDLRGKLLTNASGQITVRYLGDLPQPRDYIVINEIHYHATLPDASFVELYNRSSTVPFDLSNCRFQGLNYVFGPGAILAPNSYLLLVQDRSAFTQSYGSAIAVYDQFSGTLSPNGEYLALIDPGLSRQQDAILSQVRYDSRPPWPTNADGAGPSLQLIDPEQDETRVGNWTSTAPGALNQATPGCGNSVRGVLTEFPSLWINEAQPNNLSSLIDNAGELDPWIELFNSGDKPIDLSAFYLSDNLTNLTQWQFPEGSILDANQYLIVWLDGEPSESIPGAPHATFRLDPSDGIVVLVRLQEYPLTPKVMDYVVCSHVLPGHSRGSYPDGQCHHRRTFAFPSPGTPNNPSYPSVRVVINEFMAANNQVLADPADNQFDDWIELHNAGDIAVDLSGYCLTDDLADSSKFEIPEGTFLDPHEFLLVWADEEQDQFISGGSLHANFKLSASGEQIGLFNPDGILLDGFSFGPQTANTSMGRYPDGDDSSPIPMDAPTPLAANVVLGGNRPPILSPIGPKTVAENSSLAFTATGLDPDAGQTLTYGLSAEAPPGASMDPTTGWFSWTPSEEQGPGTYAFRIRATDNGSPARSGSERITVTVLEHNQAPKLEMIADQTVDEGSLFALDVQASDPDRPDNQLQFSLGASAPDGMAIDPVSGHVSWIPSEIQGPGSWQVVVRVSDNGSPMLANEQLFTVAVREVDNPPVFEEIQPQTIDELVPWSLVVVARDPDAASQAISYNLDQAPSGARIDAATGRINWTPDEAQGPANAIFVVRATQNGASELSDTRTFSVSVRELNQPPKLAETMNFIVLEGGRLEYQVIALDADLPRQQLSYNLVSGALPGMTLDTQTGLLTWAVDPDQGPGTYYVGVSVSDDGPGQLAANQEVEITVQSKFHVVINEILYHPAVDGAQFVELFNSSSKTSHDLSDLELAGNHLKFTFPSGTILAPKACLCVAQNADVFARTYPGNVPLAGSWTGSLAIQDTLRLIQPAHDEQPFRILCLVSFRNTLPWPPQAHNPGVSLQLIDAAQDIRRVANWTAATTLQDARVLVSMTNRWRYYQAGPIASANWISAHFDDSSWPEGPALLYVENDTLPAPKKTLLILGQPTYYFRTQFEMPFVAAGIKLLLKTIIDDGAVVYLNGQEIHRLNMPSGVVRPDLWATTAAGNAVLEGPFELPTSNLAVGLNTLAVEVHQINNSSTDIVMGMELIVEGNLDPSSPGTPNPMAARLPKFPDLWISELLPSNLDGLADSQNDHDPWIEIWNSSAEMFSLNGFFLTDNYTNLNQWAFPDQAIIGPGEYALVWADAETEESQFNEWHASIRLNPRSGSLALVQQRNLQSIIIDYVDYQVPGDDVAFGLIPGLSFLDHTTLASPTPGQPNPQARASEIRLLGIRWLEGSGFAVSWTAYPGQTYQLQARANFANSSWENVGPPIVGAGDTLEQRDGNPDSGQRFYRVITVE